MGFSCDDFLDAVRKHRPSINLEYLLPSESRKVAIESAFEFKLDAVFLEFYEKTDGSSKCVFSGMRFYSLNEMIGHYGDLNSVFLDNEDFFRDRHWSRSWVPFMGTDGVLNVCLDMKGSFTNRQGQVLVHRTSDPTRTIVAPSFERWLIGLAHLLRSNCLDSHGFDVSRVLWDIGIPEFPIDYDANSIE